MCAEPPDRAVLDERPRDRGLRMVAPHEGLHHDDAGARGGVPRLLGLGGPARVGLLDQDVLAGLDRLQRPLVVHAVRERDVDGVDPVVVEQRLVAAVGALDPVLARVGLRAGAVAARHGGDLDLRRRRLEQRVVDLRGGEQPQLHRESSPAAASARRASASSSAPGSPLTPTAPTRRSPSKAATPPRKNVKNGSKLASSAAVRADLLRESARRDRVAARRRVRLALGVQPRIGRGAVHRRGGDELAVPVRDEHGKRRRRLAEHRLRRSSVPAPASP